jgi:hypothetical protein
VNLLDSLCDASGRSWGLIVGVMLACRNLVGCLAWPLYCWLGFVVIVDTLDRV